MWSYDSEATNILLAQASLIKIAIFCSNLSNPAEKPDIWLPQSRTLFCSYLTLGVGALVTVSQTVRSIALGAHQSTAKFSGAVADKLYWLTYY